MATMIRDLWPDDVTNVNVVSPLAIMRFQASQLRKRTQNLLEAEVESISSEKWVEHRFIVIAPALNRYRVVLFAVSHDAKDVYPARFIAGFENADVSVKQRLLRDAPADEVFAASTQGEFMQRIGEVLSSRHVKSLIQSLIVQSNEARASTGDFGGSESEA